MKLFSFLVVFLSIVQSAVAQYNVVVKGAIEGISEGRICVVAQLSEGRVDTLAQAKFSESKFVVRAYVSEPMMVKLIVAGYSGGFEFFAEPKGRYDALLTNDSRAYIRGGGYQKHWITFQNRLKSLSDSVLTYQAKYDEMRQANKLRSASRLNDTIKALKLVIDETQESFIVTQNNILSAYFIYTTAQQKSAELEDSRRLYNKLGDVAKKTLSGRILLERIRRLELTSQGQKAPDFVMPTADGKLYNIHEVKAKVKIIDFWASWCGPCRLNNRSLKQIYADYHPYGLEIIGVSMDDNRTKWLNALKEEDLPWLNISDLKAFSSDVAKLYNITTIPALFVLDEKNNIIARNLKGEALRKFLEARFSSAQ